MAGWLERARRLDPDQDVADPHRPKALVDRVEQRAADALAARAREDRERLDVGDALLRLQRRAAGADDRHHRVADSAAVVIAGDEGERVVAPEPAHVLRTPPRPRILAGADGTADRLRLGVVLAEGRPERFEIVYMTGWAPDAVVELARSLEAVKRGPDACGVNPSTMRRRCIGPASLQPGRPGPGSGRRRNVRRNRRTLLYAPRHAPGDRPAG